MNKSWLKVTFTLVCLLCFSAQMTTLAPAQNRQDTGRNSAQLKNTAQRIRTRFDNFRARLDSAIENVRLGDDAAAESINRSIDDFETSLDLYQDRLKLRQADVIDVQPLFKAACQINGWLKNTQLNERVDRSWSNVRMELARLGDDYNLPSNNNSINSNPQINSNPSDNLNSSNESSSSINSSSVVNSRLTGTYRLDVSRSDNAIEVADRAVYQLPSSQRNGERDMLAQRLETPELLAIDQSGQQVTIASTRAQRYTFLADGSEKVETSANGTTLRVRASTVGERLEVTTLGDRVNDYSVIFELIDENRTLRLTRRIATNYLRQPVIVTSIYEKISETAQLDIYERPNTSSVRSPNDDSSDDNSSDDLSGNNSRSAAFVVPNNTALKTVLNESVSTKTTKESDRFTVTVQTPEEYRGAIIEGHISGVNRSGKVTGRPNLKFNFETIRLSDGKTYNFAGFVESVRTTNGDEIKVNTEGNAQGNNQGKQTAARGAVGAAVGALIGAITGGGKGALIGAIVGGGVGAGSVYIEGREDLEISGGSDVHIRASNAARSQAANEH